MALTTDLDLVVVYEQGLTSSDGTPVKGYFEAVGTKLRRTKAVGNVIVPAVFRIDLDGQGNLTKSLPANVDAQIEVDDVYNVTAHLTDQSNKPLAVSIPSFTMRLLEGGGPYRLSDFIFGTTTPPDLGSGGSGGGTVFDSSVFDPTVFA